MMKIVVFFFILGPAMWASDAVGGFWFSGAEINRYELDQSRYGENHPGHVEFIFVTEPFLIDKQVKDETGSGKSTDVLKLNALRTFNTGIYSYRTMTSTFKPIETERFPHALKSNTSVQDWCGQAFQQINQREGGWKVQSFSYFEKEGDVAFELPDAWLEDEIWLQIRLNPADLPRGETAMIPGALQVRFAHRPIEVVPAVAELKVGAEVSQYILRYPEDGRVLTIRFDTHFPHIIRGWEDAGRRGTTTAVLKNRIMHSEYWSENKPADREKRSELGLAPIAD